MPIICKLQDGKDIEEVFQYESPSEEEALKSFMQPNYEVLSCTNYGASVRCKATNNVETIYLKTCIVRNAQSEAIFFYDGNFISSKKHEWLSCIKASNSLHALSLYDLCACVCMIPELVKTQANQNCSFQEQDYQWRFKDASSMSNVWLSNDISFSSSFVISNTAQGCKEKFFINFYDAASLLKLACIADMIVLSKQDFCKVKADAERQLSEMKQ